MTTPEGGDGPHAPAQGAKPQSRKMGVTPRPEKADPRADRLAAALRENLKKRKSLSAARRQAGDGPQDGG